MIYCKLDLLEQNTVECVSKTILVIQLNVFANCRPFRFVLDVLKNQIVAEITMETMSVVASESTGSSGR